MARTFIGLRDMLRQPVDMDHEELWYKLEHSNYLVQKGRMDAEHWLKRGTLLYSFRRYEEAVTCLNMVLVERPNEAEAYFLKGVCYQLLALAKMPRLEVPTPQGIQLFAKARACFEAAVKLAPGDEEAHAALRTLDLVLGRASARPEAEPAAREPDAPGLHRVPPLRAKKPDPGMT